MADETAMQATIQGGMPLGLKDNAILPLNRVHMRPEEVAVVYASLLGRQPENSDLWTDRGALDSILMIAASPEAQARYMPQTDLQITEGKLGTFATYRKDLVIGAAIRAGGQFEEQAVLETLSFLESLGENVNRTTFLDIGANIGTHNIAALKNGFKKAICIEADCDNYKLLKVNHLLNDLDQRCVDVYSAVSDMDGDATLELSDTNFGDHRVKVAGVGDVLAVHGEQERGTRSVPVRRLDTLLNELAIQPDQIGLAWIDTQGHEGQVLSGATSLLASPVPLVLEFWPYGLHRAGGYKAFRAGLSQRSRYYDLRRSLETGSPVAYGIDDLDQLFDDWLRQESSSCCPHTDLLVL